MHEEAAFALLSVIFEHAPHQLRQSAHFWEDQAEAIGAICHTEICHCGRSTYEAATYPNIVDERLMIGVQHATVIMVIFAGLE